MNQPPSSNSQGSEGNKNRRRRRRPSGGQSNQGGQPKQQNASQNSSNNGPKPASRSRRGGRNRRRRGGGSNSTGSKTPQLRGIEQVRAKYLTLVEKHVEARRKYYDLFHRADPNQLRKLEREFTDSQAQILAYEESLSPSDREMLHKDYGGKPEDRVYSSNHDLTPEAEKVPTKGDFEDPHVLESQKQADFKNDTEESVGTIEDYKKLKGLT